MAFNRMLAGPKAACQAVHERARGANARSGFAEALIAAEGGTTCR